LKTKEFRGPLYISMSARSSSDPGPTVHEIAAQHFAELLRTNSSPGFRASFQYFESEDHGSVPLLSLYHGLCFIFEDYSPTGDAWDKPAALSAHFKQVSEKLGYSVLPPEGYIDDLGSWKLDSAHDTNSALACFQLNVSNYPASFNAWQSLGGAFKVMGDQDSALKCFERSLELNPDNRDVTRQIQRLNPAPIPTNAYMVMYEAECGRVGTNWQVLTDPNASNGKYATITPGLNSTSIAPTNRHGDWIVIPVSLAKSGDFVIFARCNDPTADDDSFWVSMDRGPLTMFNGLVTSGWEWVSLGTYTLNKGAHTLSIGYREDGATLDKISISDYPLAPPGTGQPANNICGP
jgi:tetratricopeptide (TPR) repeat protein